MIQNISSLFRKKIRKSKRSGMSAYPRDYWKINNIDKIIIKMK